MRSIRTFRLSSPAGRPITMSAFARNVIGPPSGHRICASVTGCHVRRSGGKHSTNCVTRTTARLRTSASSPRERLASHVPRLLSSTVSRVMASSTRSPGVASPRQLRRELVAPVRHLPAGDGRGPGERGRGEEVSLAGQDLGDVELVDGEAPLVEAGGESTMPADASVRSSATKAGSKTSGSSSMRRSASRVRRCAGVSMLSTVRHGCHSGLSRADEPPLTRAPLCAPWLHAELDDGPVRPRRTHPDAWGQAARSRGPELPLPTPGRRRRSHPAAPAGRWGRVGAGQGTAVAGRARRHDRGCRRRQRPVPPAATRVRTELWEEVTNDGDEHGRSRVA